ncbi:MAG: two-component regulator propeller domain-containing protein [Bacteroidota bacterium]
MVSLWHLLCRTKTADYLRELSINGNILKPGSNPICYLKTILLLLLSASSYSQLSFHHLSMATGLSDNDVNSMAVDSNGYLWAGTSYGLNRYDGYGITNYYSQTNPALQSNDVYDIVCDHLNRLWVLTLSGVTIIDQQRKFDTIPMPAGIGNVRTIIFSPSVGVIMAGQTFYLLPLGKNPLIPGDWQPMPWCSSWNNKDQLREISHYKDDWFVVTTKQKAELVNFKTRQITCSVPLRFSRQSCMINDTLMACLNFRGSVQLHEVPGGRLIHEYFFRSNDRGSTILNNLYGLRLAANGELLVTSANGGLFRLNLSTGALVNDIHNANDPASIATNYTHQLLCLPNGTVLVSSHTNGLDITNLNQHQSNTQHLFSDAENNVYDGFINGMVKDKTGMLWLGAQTGVVQWNPVNNTSRFFDFPHIDPETGSPKKLIIRTVSLDSNNRIWVSAYGGGIGYFSPQKNAIVRLPFDSTMGRLFRSQFIHQFLVQSSGRIWAGSGSGLFSIDHNTLEILDNSKHPLLKKLEGTRVFALAEDQLQQLWIGTSANGIYCYSEAKQTLRQYTIATGLAANQCLALCSDGSGNIYAATPNGLSIINASGSTRIYNAANGLRNNKCQSVVKDKTGNIWVANQQYLVKYKPADSSFTYYDNNAGLTSESYRNGAAFAAADGTLYWGTANGVNYFLPEQLGENNVPMQVNISSMQSTDSIFSTLAGNRFSLAQHQTDITLHFAAIDLMGSKNILYQYQLNGLSNTWDTATDIRQITYSALAPGKYTFLLKVSKDGLHWQDSEPVYFTIARPWYRTWWFVAICLAMAATAIFILIRNRERTYRLAQQQQAKEMQYKLELGQALNAVQQQELELALLHKNLAGAQLTATRAQMNPHFIFNALNSVQQYILQGNVDEANKYLAKFSRLQREILNHCDQQFITLQKEIDMIRLYVEFEQLRLNDSFHFSVTLDEDIDTDELLIPPMVLQPFIENAIWHGLQPRESERRLSIDFALDAIGDYLLCTITDNGIGRSAAGKNKVALQKQPHISKGLHLVSERLDLLQQQYGGTFKATITDLYHADQTSNGTRVEVMFFIGVNT